LRHPSNSNIIRSLSLSKPNLHRLVERSEISWSTVGRSLSFYYNNSRTHFWNVENHIPQKLSVFVPPRPRRTRRIGWARSMQNENTAIPLGSNHLKTRRIIVDNTSSDARGFGPHDQSKVPSIRRCAYPRRRARPVRLSGSRYRRPPAVVYMRTNYRRSPELLLPSTAVYIHT